MLRQPLSTPLQYLQLISSETRTKQVQSYQTELALADNSSTVEASCTGASDDVKEAQNLFKGLFQTMVTLMRLRARLNTRAAEIRPKPCAVDPEVLQGSCMETTVRASWMY